MMKKREVMSLLKSNGWEVVKGGKGSHTKMVKGSKTLYIPGHNQGSEIPIGTLNAILKQAGIK